jgi:hypothetical protein
MPLLTSTYADRDGNPVHIISVGNNGTTSSLSKAIGQSIFWTDNATKTQLFPVTEVDGFPIKIIPYPEIQSNLLTIDPPNQTAEVINFAGAQVSQPYTHKGILLQAWVNPTLVIPNVTSILLQPQYRKNSADPWFKWGEPERMNVALGEDRQIDWDIRDFLGELRVLYIEKTGTGDPPPVNFRYSFSDQ